jgi:hypothetical protein
MKDDRYSSVIDILIRIHVRRMQAFVFVCNS